MNRLLTCWGVRSLVCLSLALSAAQGSAQATEGTIVLTGADRRPGDVAERRVGVDRRSFFRGTL